MFKNISKIKKTNYMFLGTLVFMIPFAAAFGIVSALNAAAASGAATAFNSTATAFGSVAATTAPTQSTVNMSYTPSSFAAIGAGIAGIGVIGTGFGQGLASSRACEAIGRNPEAETKVRNQFIIGAAITESGALYTFTIAIMILFVL